MFDQNRSTIAPRKPGYLKTGVADKKYVDYKAVEDLRRLMTPNGKIYSRKRLGVSAREQRMISQAIKRARHMGLLPYTNATL
ncbi:MAG TPA: 30S ribosomal protein S18 [Phycisphaerales bacterium]|nr:30S ribosomal protein S18 [Phycisphaerales bacterium]HRQ74392.1 30S ribosomal protein S18 [Phycisphaerales bacterium]